MAMRAKLYSFYRFFQRRIVPGLEFSQYRYQAVLENAVRPDTNWLDLGCGHQLLPEWRLDEERLLVSGCKQIIGVDPDLPSLKRHRTISCLVNASASRLPFRDSTFDLVTANMVVEHLADPIAQFVEVFRVLKPGGRFIFHTPNKRGYLTQIAKLLPENLKPALAEMLQGRKAHDVFPAYYRANSEVDITAIADETGFDLEQTKMLVSSANLALVPGAFIPELLWTRLLMTERMRAYRPYMIAVLRKRCPIDMPSDIPRLQVGLA